MGLVPEFLPAVCVAILLTTKAFAGRLATEPLGRARSH